MVQASRIECDAVFTESEAAMLEALNHLLGLPDLRVERYHFDQDGTLFIEVQPVFPIAVCPKCKTIADTLHDYDELRRVRDCSVWGAPCYLVWRPRRFDCARCGKPFTEISSAAEPNRRFTPRYEQYIFRLCRGSDLSRVASLEDLSDDEAEGIYLRQGESHLAEQRTPLVRILGIDEIALKKGHGNFVLVLSAPAQSRVVAVLEDRSQQTLEKWLDQLAPDQPAAIASVCIDMWEPYSHAIQKKLPHAQIVVDRFHVPKNLNDALTKARREVQRQAPDEVREALKGCRWLLVHNREDLTAEQRAHLEAACAACPELKTCYNLKEEFRELFSLPDRATAEPALREWQRKVEQSGVKAFEPFLTTLNNWGRYILNYFDQRLTSGFVEGMNNKIKLLKRIAFGFRNFDNFVLRVRIECAPPPAMLPH